MQNPLDVFNRWFSRLLALVVILALAVVGHVVGRAVWQSQKTIFDLLRESRELRRAIANLTAESQIGCAKVLSQKTEQGRTTTELLFAAPSKDDPARPALERRVTIEGDVAHFDALIVRFDRKIVEDGQARALHLWRRIYGEKTPPEQGAPIETPGEEPERYREVFRLVPRRERATFWTSIWSLAHDHDRLREGGITAIYGNALYTQMRPGTIYVFKLGATGDFHIETVPAL